jgi:hypothetical protein
MNFAGYAYALRGMRPSEGAHYVSSPWHLPWHVVFGGGREIFLSHFFTARRADVLGVKTVVLRRLDQ